MPNQIHKNDESMPEQSGPIQISTKPSPVPKINHKYLATFTLFFSLASSIQTGIVFNEMSMVNAVLGSKMGWKLDGTASSKY